MKAKPLRVLLEHRRMLRECNQDLLEIDILIVKMVKALDYRIGLYNVHPEGVRHTRAQITRQTNFYLARSGIDLI